MSRKWIAAAVAAALAVLPATGAFAAEAQSAAPTLTLSGTLEYVSSFGLPHFEVNGYVLVFPDETQAASLRAETSVLVMGEELTGPSIAMRKSLKVLKIVPRTGSVPAGKPAPSGSIPAAPPSGVISVPVVPEPTPSTPASGPGRPGDQIVTLPIMPNPDAPTPSPGWSGHPKPSVPPTPTKLFGSQLLLLFGRVEQAGGRFYIVSQRPSGEVRYWVTSATVDLAALIGQRIGATAAVETLADGSVRYRLETAIHLLADLSRQITSGGGVFYIAPRGEITIQLRGKQVHLDQAPIVGNGRTLVPLRAVAEAMGATVTWDQTTHTARVVLGTREVVVSIGTDAVLLRQGGQERYMQTDIAPVITGGRTMVPLRVIAEGLGLSVSWNDQTRTVAIQ